MVAVKNLEAIVIDTKIKARASVIWLHGLGADGGDFVSMVPELHLQENLGIRFIFPHAPVRPVTINGGYMMRAWYDIYGFERNSPQDEMGIQATQQAIDELIAAEIERGIAAEKIILAGFSQGGAMALHVGLRYSKALAGILGLSTYLPLSDKLAQQRNLANNQTNIMLAHGTKDLVVPLVLGEITRDYLKQLNYQVSWHTYPMQHQVCAQEIQDISAWIKKMLI